MPNILNQDLHGRVSLESSTALLALLKQGGGMLENWEKDRFMEKVFNVALKEIFSQFHRKYDHPIVFEVWAEIMRNRGSNDNFSKWIWSPQRTIQEAVDSLQSFSDLIESTIQQRKKKDRPE